MKKKSLLLLALALVCAMSFIVGACSAKETFRTATAYGDVHWNGMGAITVKVDNNDKIVDVVIDEFFLPYTWLIPAAGTISEYTEAVKTAHTVKADAANTSGGTGATLTSSNKYIRIGDKYFEAKTDAASTVNRGTRTAVGYKQIDGNIEELMTYILDETKQENGKWFHEAALNQDCAVVMEVDASKTKLSERFKDVSVAAGNGKSLNKRNSQYWTPSGTNLGLKVNMAYLEDYLIHTNRTPTYTKAQLTWADNVVKVNGVVVAGATASDSPAYLWVAKLAYDLAIAK